MTIASTEGCPSHARLCQASADPFQQRSELLPLGNRGLNPLAVPVLPISVRIARAQDRPIPAPTGHIGGSVGHEHVYSTPYTATSPILGLIPVATFVAWEDPPFPTSDFNYNDLNFVFTNVSVSAPSLALAFQV
jgi:hypothetical protein